MTTCLTVDAPENYIATFVKQVLPWVPADAKSVVCLAWTELNEDCVRWRSASLKSANDLLKKINKMRSAETARDIYVCMSAQANEGGGSRRSAATSVWFKGLWADIDVKADGYPNTLEAATALIDFLKEASLPNPTILVQSGGGGLHVHWLFDKVVDRAEWEPLARALTAAMREHGLKADLPCTTDPCRLLRVPETLNHKYAPPRPVEMHRRVGKCHTAEEWREKLSPWIGSATASRHDLQRQLGLPPLLVTHQVTDELGAGIELTHWFDELDGAAKDETVAFALSHLDNKTDDPRDRWLRVLFAVADAHAKGCGQARELALEWSRAGASWTSEADFDLAWASADPGRGGAVTVGTLLKMASDAAADFSRWRESKGKTEVTATPLQAKRGAIGIAELDRTPPHRKWLHGVDLARGAISLLVAPGGRGKSSWLLAMAMACASGRPLLGAKVFGGPLRVLYINLEDPAAEIARRVCAARQKFNIREDELDGLFVAGAGHLSLSLLQAERGIAKYHEPSWKLLVEQVEQCRPDVLVIDPLVAAVGGVTLNDNAAAALLMQRMVRLAESRNLAVMIAHHSAKGRDLGSQEAAMGAASLVNMARISLALEPLTDEDAKKLMIAPCEAKSAFRITGTKQNLSAASLDDRLFKLASVTLDNAEPPVYPEGDNVAVVVPFDPSKAIARFSQAAIQAALSAISSAPEPLSPSARSGMFADPIIGHAIAPHCPGPAGEHTGRDMLLHLQRLGLVLVEKTPVRRPGRGSYVRDAYAIAKSPTTRI